MPTLGFKGGGDSTSLHRPAVPERRAECAVVQVIQLAADRHPVRQLGDLGLGAGQLVGKEMRRRLAVDGGAGRQNDLLDAVLVNTGQQARDVQVLRPVARGKLRRVGVWVNIEIDAVQRDGLSGACPSR